MTLSARAALGALALLACVSLVIPQTTHGAITNVSMSATRFSPQNITIRVGDSIAWTNSSSVPHTVTSNNGVFDSGTIQPGGYYSLTFNAPGTYSYRCLFHNGMTGTITVVAGGFAPPAYTPQPAYIPPYTYTPAPSQIPPSTADQLRAQAQALIARVQQLQAQLGTTGGAYAPGVGIDSSSCPLIGVVLKPGSSGEDVRRLQAFLARDPSVYSEAIVNGFYGPLTEAAVRRWQTKYNIVSSGSPGTNGFGQVGPRTAAAIALLCTTGSYGGVPGPTGSPNVGGFIQVTPISGRSPLSVSVQTTVNTVNSCAGANYVLDYGDDTTPSQVAVPPGSCTQATRTFRHVYRYGGTYQITLSSGGHRTTASVQVTGAGPPTPTPPTPTPTPPTPTPTPPPPAAGSWGIVTVTPAVDGDPFKTSVEIQYPACAAYSMDWGAGAGPESVGAGTGCSGGSASATFYHTYSNTGGYTITLRDGSGTTKATAGVTIE